MTNDLLVYGVRLRHSFEYRYVGLTRVSIDSRAKAHIGNARRIINNNKSAVHTPFYDWLVKHFLDDVVFEQIDVAQDIDTLRKLEVFWWEYLASVGHRLLNSAYPGMGGFMIKGDQEAERRRKISASRKSAPSVAFSDSHKANLSKALKGKTRTAETRKRMSQAQQLRAKNWNPSGEARKAMGNGRRGTKLSPEHIDSIKKFNHDRWHEARQVVKPECKHCQEK